MADKIKTYPEMNEKIVDILRISDAPDKLYAAQYIEDLHAENERLKEALSNLFEACLAADVEGELSERINGEILDAAREALNEVTK